MPRWLGRLRNAHLAAAPAAAYARLRAAHDAACPLTFDFELPAFADGDVRQGF